MLKVIEAIIKGPIFSIQRPLSYQVGDSLILPQPSTLVGALSFCLSKAELIKAQGYGNTYLKNLIKIVREGLARVTVKPLTPIISTPVLLSRLRTLEWSIDKIEKKISRGEKLTNAMIREYVFGTYSIYFLFTDNELAKKSIKSLPLLSRIGDTESLSSVVSVDEAKFVGKRKKGLVNTYTPCDWVTEISENFLIARLCEEEYIEHVLEEMKGEAKTKVKERLKLSLKFFRNFSRNFYLPLTIEKASKEYLVYRPAEFLAKVEEDYVIAHFRTKQNEVKIVVKEEWLT